MKQRIYFLIQLILKLFLFQDNGFSGRGNTDFWFAAPEEDSGHSDQLIYIHLTSFNQTANVTIAEPANTVNFPPWPERYHRQRIKIFLNTGQCFVCSRCQNRLRIVYHES